MIVWITVKVLVFALSQPAGADELICGHLLDSTYVQNNCQEDNLHNECGRPVSPGVNFAPWFSLGVYEDLASVENSVTFIDGLANVFRFQNESVRVKALEYSQRDLILDMVLLSGKKKKQVFLSMDLHAVISQRPLVWVYRGQADILMNFEQFADLSLFQLNRFFRQNPHHPDIHAMDFACTLDVQSQEVGITGNQ